MKQLHNFAEANRRLAEFVERSSKPGAYKLDRMYRVMDFLGNPQEQLKIIHVAGTSGKTSTSYYAAALLQAAGQKVGLTVSPHVSEVNERVQINLVPLAEAQFCRELSEFLKLLEPSGLEPTYFELLVALAYWEFARQQCDYAVIEVGLGGLLDGTNVVRRADKICVITDVGLDHMQILGSNVSEIAAQKAGIIGPGNEVFCYRQGDAVDAVIAAQAAKQQATLHVIEVALTPAELGFLPLFQQRNFGLARAAVNRVLQRDGHQSLTTEQIITAAHMLVPARMEIFHRAGKTIILDGAHNAQKLSALAASIRAQFPDQPAAALVSFTASREEQLGDVLAEIKKIATSLIATTFPAAQDLPHLPVEPTQIVDAAHQLNFAHAVAIAKPEPALTALLARPETVLLVSGSFYLCSAIRPLLAEI